jgi:hypothetical protein
MSEVVGEAVVNIRTDDHATNFDAEGKKAGKSYAGGFGSSIKAVIGIAAVAVAGRAALSFAKGAVGEAREAQKVGATTTQIIKSTGGAAKITARQVGDLATAISNKAGVDDEAIQSGANLLLTFTGVRNEVGKGNDVFNQATQAAVDLSAAGFGSITSASVQLGKALNDPVKGISALSRSGVTFTAQQQTQIKTLVASGKTLEAQKIILAGVQEQVGGVAAAQATAGEKAKVAYGNIKESIGTLLLPVIDAAENAFVNVLAPGIQKAISAASGLPHIFRSIHDTIGPLVAGPLHVAGEAVKVFFDVIHGQGATSDSNSPFIALAAQAAVFVKGALPQIVSFVRTQVIPALQSIGSQVLPVIQTASNTFRTVLLPAIVSLASYVIANLVPILGQVAQIFVTQVIPTVLAIAKYLYGTLYPAIVAIVTQVAHQLVPVFNTLIDVFRRDVLPTVQRLIAQIRTQLLPALEPLIAKILVVVGFLLKLAAAILARVLPPLLRLAGFILVNLIPVLVKIIVVVVKVIDKILGIGIAIAKIIGKIGEFIGKMASLARDGIGHVIDAVTHLPQAIAGLGPKMLNAGKALIGALLRGLSRAGGFAANFAGSVWGILKGLLNGAIDHINSALEFSISVGFGKHITINPPDIPRLALGTRDFAGGLALVGERGPELAVLPQHTQVVPAPQTAAALAGGDGVVIHLYGDVRPHNYRDFERSLIQQGRQAALGGPRPVRGVSGGVR